MAKEYTSAATETGCFRKLIISYDELNIHNFWSFEIKAQS